MELANALVGIIYETNFQQLTGQIKGLLIMHFSPPRAVLGRLLELEGRARQRVPRQRPGGRSVDRAGGHGVARSGCGEERSGSGAGLEEEVPGRTTGLK